MSDTYVDSSGETRDRKTGKDVNPPADTPEQAKADPSSAGAAALAPQSPMQARFMKGMDKLDALQADEEKQFKAGEAAAQPIRDREMKELMTTVQARAHLEKLKDAPKPEDYQKGSMEFASSMALVGAVFGKFSRAGGTGALNAFTGALKGWHDGNMEAYANKQKEWEENTKKTLENNQMEIEKYKEIVENKKLNIDQMAAGLTLAAQPFQNKLMFDYAQEKNINGALSLYDKMVGIQERLKSSTETLLGFNENDLTSIKSSIDQYNAHPEQLAGLTNEQFQKLRILGEQHGWTLNNPAAGPVPFKGQAKQLTPEQQAYAQSVEEHPDWTAEQRQAFIQAGKSSRSGASSYMTKFKQEHPNAFVRVNLMRQWLFIPQLQRRAGTLAARGANVDVAVREADKAADQALQASDAIPRGTFMPLNQLQQAIRTKTSSPEQARFGVANAALITAYAQTMSRTGVNTVTAQNRASEVLNTASSPEAYRAAVGQLKTEMRIVQDAVRDSGGGSGQGDVGAPPAGGGGGTTSSGVKWQIKPDNASGPRSEAPSSNVMSDAGPVGGPGSRLAMALPPEQSGVGQFQMEQGGGGGGGSIPIRSQKSLNRAIDNAHSDEELIRIKRLLEKRGIDTSIIPAFRGLP